MSDEYYWTLVVCVALVVGMYTGYMIGTVLERGRNIAKRMKNLDIRESDLKAKISKHTKYDHEWTGKYDKDAAKPIFKQ